MASSASGRLCGAVRFATDGNILFCVNCHCAWCRKAHGAAFVTWYGVKESDFVITSGKDKLRFFRSSNESERGFCTSCGTTMFFRSSVAGGSGNLARFPGEDGEMHVALACADEGTVDQAPSANVFWDAHVVWVEGFDALPKHDRNHAGISKYQVIPERPS